MHATQALIGQFLFLFLFYVNLDQTIPTREFKDTFKFIKKNNCLIATVRMFLEITYLRLEIISQLFSTLAISQRVQTRKPL